MRQICHFKPLYALFMVIKVAPGGTNRKIGPKPFCASTDKQFVQDKAYWSVVQVRQIVERFKPKISACWRTDSMGWLDSIHSCLLSTEHFTFFFRNHSQLLIASNAI